MLQTDQTEEIICLAATLDRPAVLRQIRNFRAGFPVDFTAEYLDTLSLDRLRHVYVAMCLQGQRRSNRLASKKLSPEPVGV